MTRLTLLLTAALFLPACGGPTGPDSGSAQAIVENSTPTLTVAGAPVQPGATVTVAQGTSVSYRVDYRNNSGQVFHYGVMVANDNGMERLESCGAAGSGGEGGGFGSGLTVASFDPMYARGRTVRVVLLGALGPNVSGPGQCYLQITQGVPNHANVQTERVLMTLVVQ